MVSNLVYRTPKLQECTRDSIFSSILQASELGLDLSPPMGEGYLIPRWNGRAKVLECQFQPGYRGLVALARRSGEIAMIHRLGHLDVGDVVAMVMDSLLPF